MVNIQAEGGFFSFDKDQDKQSNNFICKKSWSDHGIIINIVAWPYSCSQDANHRLSFRSNFIYFRIFANHGINLVYPLDLFNKIKKCKVESQKWRWMVLVVCMQGTHFFEIDETEACTINYTIYLTQSQLARLWKIYRDHFFLNKIYLTNLLALCIANAKENETILFQLCHLTCHSIALQSSV